MSKNCRYCIVPMCGNTSVSTPDRVFFNVPWDKEIRKIWCITMGRQDYLSAKKRAYCCSDHFDLEKDTENYLQWTLLPDTRIKLKAGIFPHRFDCQISRPEILDMRDNCDRIRVENMDDTHYTCIRNSAVFIKEEKTDEPQPACLSNSEETYETEPAYLGNSFVFIKEEKADETEATDVSNSFVFIKEETTDETYSSYKMDHMEGSSYYKYCLVPGCKSTTIKNPNKIFISLPMPGPNRQRWLKAVWRNPEELSSKNRRLYVCEDHFNLEEDIENWMEYKLSPFKVRLRVKKNVVPHIFACQPERKQAKKKSCRRNLKQSRKALVKDVSLVRWTSKHPLNLASTKRVPRTDIGPEAGGLIDMDQEGKLLVADNGISDTSVVIKEEKTDEIESNFELSDVKPEEMIIAKDGDQDSIDTDSDIYSKRGSTDSLQDFGKTVDSKHTCPYCKHKALYPNKLKTHIMSCHAGDKPHKCFLCDFSTVWKYHLKRHIMACHKGEKPHQCPYCDYKAVENYVLKNHVMTHHTGEKPYQCHDCEYKSSKKRYLKEHIMARHLGVKPHQCPHCDYRAAQLSNLKTHVKYVHKFEN